MSKEYIEREAALKNIKETIIGASEFANDIRIAAMNAVSFTPTADVQEVRHGKNVTTMNPVDEFECSECGFVCEIWENIYDDEYTLDCQREYNPKVCPECGAKMDKE